VKTASHAPDLTDRAARDRIRESTDRTLFVDAGAGSGKTKALVDRVKTLVLVDGVSIEHIAAVTFTEKAAAELRDRLRSALEKATTEGTVEKRQRAEAALDELDFAAIGTLHSFAQRILTLHPIEARIPPRVEVLDEVGSSVASDDRWAVIQRRLLDDDGIGDVLVSALAMGIKLDQLRSLARAFNTDWDLIEDRIVGEPPTPRPPDATVFFAQAAGVAAHAADCTKDDKLRQLLGELGDTVARYQPQLLPEDQFELVRAISAVKPGNRGAAANWPKGFDLAGLKRELKELIAAAETLCGRFIDEMLRPLAHWVARRVVEAAEERSRTGELEFHDLLVLARRLLRADASVRESLSQRYRYLLLDEFQDTDPIQIELALRIAGGWEASGPLESIEVPEGSVFVVGDPKQSIYRFRRADIARYLQTRAQLGETLTLTTNFRSVEPVIGWVNRVFGSMITFQQDRQPAYEDLAPHRSLPDLGPPVAVIGAEAHPDKTSADEVRLNEARDVAATIRTALAEGWTVQDGNDLQAPARKIERRDIAVLLPARTSLAALEEALEDAGIPYRAESSSLVYQADEVRDLLAAARAVADPSDPLALVTALRSPLFGLGDDDLWSWRRQGGAFHLLAPVSDALIDHPVATALAYLKRLHNRVRWLPPHAVLILLIADRRMLEVASTQPRTRDHWRRLRFVVDQARAWSEAQHGGLRSYLTWVARQSEEGSRVAEAILPETDVDAVRIMTIHGAKGLEFPMVIVSGLSAKPMGQRGVKLIWPPEGGYSIKLGGGIQTNDFETQQPLDEQMDVEEKKRLLYVACTRARDHLVVSLHRPEKPLGRLSETLFDHGAADAAPSIEFAELDAAETHRAPTEAAPPPDWDTWSAEVAAARAAARRNPAVTASGLEGTDPGVVFTVSDAGLAKGARDVELPPWSKGRYGSAIGSAVHAVLQTVDLATGDGLAGSVAAACLAEGVSDHAELVSALVRSALDSDLVKRAAARPHWRESWAATAQPDGTVLEGIVDLIYREDDGQLVIVDYKTDAVPGPAIAARVEIYRPQLRAYRTMLADATGAEPHCRLLFLHPDGSHEERL
jgi:ATP-dependent helicase/nuclease subunit A